MGGIVELLFSKLDFFWVGVHAPIEEIVRREAARGDLRLEAKFHLNTHNYCRYVIEVDSSQPQHKGGGISFLPDERVS
jgi:chloramphenicol 3-O phosphotransferase